MIFLIRSCPSFVSTLRVIWFAVQSRTRSPSSDSGLSELNCCRTADSIHREYAFFFSSTPAYTSSGVGVGVAGPGRTLIFGRFFSVRHFSAIPPLLKNFPFWNALLSANHCCAHIHGRLLALRLPRPPLIPPFCFPRVQAKNDASPRFWDWENSN